MPPSPEREHLIALTTSQAELVIEVLNDALPTFLPSGHRRYQLAAAIEAIDEALHPISTGGQA